MQLQIGLNILETHRTEKKAKALLLAAGFGTRLKPYTDSWPKCLMPIGGRALLEIWLDHMIRLGVEEVLVNTHAHHELVDRFLARDKFRRWVTPCYEKNLLGTAGTVRENMAAYAGSTLFLAHADNLCLCDLEAFFAFHTRERPEGTVMTMMTFATETPETCGIVELDERGIVQRFHEKSPNPPGRLANAAIYLLEPELLAWIAENPSANNFSTEVIPHFLGRIATWQNHGVLRDIGTPGSLKDAQKEFVKSPFRSEDLDDWQKSFLRNSIHQQIAAE